MKFSYHIFLSFLSHLINFLTPSWKEVALLKDALLTSRAAAWQKKNVGKLLNFPWQPKKKKKT